MKLNVIKFNCVKSTNESAIKIIRSRKKKEGIIISNLWVLIAVVNTIYISHKGDKRLSEFHDIHHEKFNYNYEIEIINEKTPSTWSEKLF